MPSRSDIDNALNIFAQIPESDRYNEICKFTEENRSRYNILLEEFSSINGVLKDGDDSDDLHIRKGKALENLVSFLIENSGGIFKINRDLRTTTNEIDQLVGLSSKGNELFAKRLINPKLELWLGECKNYHKTVSVTYIGKFVSLMMTTNTKIGVLFSYNGVSGTGWSNGSGLIKKFYLHKEDEEERYCIIDFNYEDFVEIKNGENLLQIIQDKILALQIDTDYRKNISKHPAEK